jgi:hypothetical protein
MSKWTKPLHWVWLAFIGTLALVSFYMPFRPQHVAPTATFEGFPNFQAHGQLRIVQVRELCSELPCSENSVTVYYLETQQKAFQLVFGCAYPPCTLDNYVQIAPGLELNNGMEITATGTLLIPSQWNSSSFEPPLYFDGDLFVFEITY